MKIKQIQEAYNLTKQDFWQHQQSGKYVLLHSAVQKIAIKENIELVKYDTLNSEHDLVRFVMTLKMGDKTITDIGEADTKNCRMGYLGCMSWKRGFDRCVLQLINGYQYGIVSEEEADDWKYQYQAPTDELKAKFTELLKSKAFDGGRLKIKSKWKTLTNNYLQKEALEKMQDEVDQFNEINQSNDEFDSKISVVASEDK